MPKSTQARLQYHDFHCGHRGGLAPSPSTLQSMRSTTNFATSMSAPPRMVSFEDGHSDACSSSSSDLEHVLMPLHQSAEQHSNSEQTRGEGTKEVRLCRSTSSHKPRLLARHMPSLSLVDLANTLGMDDANRESGLLSPRRPHSAPVSPVSGVALDPQRCLVSTPTSSLLPPAMESSAEPWGHFVDMALPDKQLRRVLPNKTVPLSARASGKSNNRKRHERRANPYGDYYKTKHPLCFQPNKSRPGLDFVVPFSESLFQLQPRSYKEPAEQIVGDFERLHFR
ncbi:unnamed protein product [Cylindrotheca closterium]|uniref:Uncharacterized protein n=1 Tax=Cylindrotheca closterium TaxID=2856 RepID=A0AAD2GBU7_9STRA|nr:unnamed protein product [Cylindrotheca closterium]